MAKGTKTKHRKVVQLTNSLGRAIVASKADGVPLALKEDRSDRDKIADDYLAAALQLALGKAKEEDRVLVLYTIGGDREIIDPTDTYFVEDGINAPDHAGNRRVVFPYALIEGWEMDPPVVPEWVSYSRTKIV